MTNLNIPALRERLAKMTIQSRPYVECGIEVVGRNDVNVCDCGSEEDAAAIAALLNAAPALLDAAERCEKAEAHNDLLQRRHDTIVAKCGVWCDDDKQGGDKALELICSIVDGTVFESPVPNRLLEMADGALAIATEEEIGARLLLQQAEAERDALRLELNGTIELGNQARAEVTALRSDVARLRQELIMAWNGCLPVDLEGAIRAELERGK